MEVGTDLRAAPAQLPQRSGSPVTDCHLICREVRRPHPEPLKQGIEARQLANVLDRHAVAAGPPVVLLGVDRDDQEYRGWHATRSHGGGIWPRVLVPIV